MEILIPILIVIAASLYITFNLRQTRRYKALGKPHWSETDPSPYIRSLFIAGALALAALFYLGLMILKAYWE
ncbi:MAG: hypothetical protein V2A54_00280 [Bacteroidota bacterium]